MNVELPGGWFELHGKDRASAAVMLRNTIGNPNVNLEVHFDDFDAPPGGASLRYRIADDAWLRLIVLPFAPRLNLPAQALFQAVEAIHNACNSVDDMVSTLRTKRGTRSLLTDWTPDISKDMGGEIAEFDRLCWGLRADLEDPKNWTGGIDANCAIAARVEYDRKTTSK
jgi:hypothetical protein